MDRNQLEEEWRRRQLTFGNTKKAVLYKNFPAFLNKQIHNQHIQFIVKNIKRNSKNILDVGCGYGRISSELKSRYPKINITGIEPCKEFSNHFEAEIGPCFNGSVEEFSVIENYDAILLITVLMYMGNNITPVLHKLWESLVDGGQLICIEPAISSLIHIRKMLKSNHFSPTGSTVNYWKKEDLIGELTKLPDAQCIQVKTIGILPGIPIPALHHCVAIRKSM
jgi:trans-aconitate methyltransferase